MTFVLAIAQCGYPADGGVLAQVASWCAEAASRGAQLLVFPEDLMSPTRLEPSKLRDYAEPLDGPFVTHLRELARRWGLWIVFTTYEANANGAPYNTAVVVDRAGEVRGTYRKCHLYDAHGVFESERNTAGESLCEAIDTPFGKLGLAICYDLRFPEVARNAALSGCELVVYPSAWHDGPEKLNRWRALLKARASQGARHRERALCGGGWQGGGALCGPQPGGRSARSRAGGGNWERRGAGDVRDRPCGRSRSARGDARPRTSSSIPVSLTRELRVGPTEPHA